MGRMRANVSRRHCNRFAIILIILASWLSACDSETKSEPQSYTVGVLVLVTSLNSSATDSCATGLKDGMSELGYIEGETITYIYDGPITNAEAIPAGIEHVLDAEPDLVVICESVIMKTFREFDENMPVVFLTAHDPVEAGFVKDLKRPGVPSTGVVYSFPHQRRLELVLQLDPTIDTVFIPNTAGSASTTEMIAEIEPFANQLDDVDLIIQGVSADSITEVPHKIDHILFPPDSRIAAKLGNWLVYAAEHQITISAPMPTPEVPNVILGYGPSYYQGGRQIAHLVDQILREQAKPSELPVEPAEYYLSISLIAAEMVDLTVPNTLLRQADWIIRPDTESSY